MTDGTSISVLIAASSEPQVSAERLTRAAFLAAQVLGDHEMESWCQSELQGYATSNVPDYRLAAAMAQATDHYGRHLPLVVEDNPALAKLLQSCPLNQRLGEVERFAAAAQGAEFKVAFQPTAAHKLINASPGAAEVYRVIQRTAFENVLVGVRQRIFDWSVNHAHESVSLPGGITFESLLGLRVDASRPTAAQPIETRGNIDLSNAQMTGTVQIVVNSPGSPPTMTQAGGVDVEALRALVREVGDVVARHRGAGLPDTELQAVESSLQELGALATVRSPRQSWVKEAVQSLRAAVEGAAGSLLAELTKPHVQALLAQVYRSVGLPGP